MIFRLCGLVWWLFRRERKLEQQGEEQARAQKELQVEKDKLAQEAKDIQMQKQEREAWEEHAVSGSFEAFF